MKDFSDRFGAIFKRYTHWLNSGRVEVARVEGRYPLNDTKGTVSKRRKPHEHESWARTKHTVVTISFSDDYEQEERRAEFSGRIPHACAAIIAALGLGPTLHNTYVDKDKWVIFVEETSENYSRLPPAK